MVLRDAEGIVQAAGGVVWRPAGGLTDAAADRDAIEVAVVHRPRYLDWTFPKGKLEPSDADSLACAVREVLEETGLTAVPERELPTTTYRDAKHRPKRVRYWAMRFEAGSFEANAEVDELRWLAPEAAAELLTYPHDREVLAGL
jgi:8-oxo-(d)GTP phosphatase